MNVSDLFDQTLFNRMLAEGYVRVQTHPDLPLRIYNYTQNTMFDREWNEVTMNCRGLITTYGGNVVARAFPKFFNYGEPGSAEIMPHEPVRVMDKADGSLIIVSQYIGHQVVASRGSFTSDQARAAYEMVERLVEEEGYELPAEGDCDLFELVGPSNRIVLSYPEDDLIYLGSVDEKGRDYQHVGPSTTKRAVEVMEYTTLAEALAAPPREHAEGFVVSSLNGRRKVKIKQDDYLRLHAIVTNCSARRLWEYAAVHVGKQWIVSDQHWASYMRLDPAVANKILETTGDDWKSYLLEGVPDEFHKWVDDTLEDLYSSVTKDVESAYYLWVKAGDLPSTGSDRWNAVKHHHASKQILGSLQQGQFDLKSVTLKAWEHVRPEGDQRPFSQSEDAA